MVAKAEKEKGRGERERERERERARVRDWVRESRECCRVCCSASVPRNKVQGP